MARNVGTDVVDGPVNRHPAILGCGVAGNFIETDPSTRTGQAAGKIFRRTVACSPGHQDRKPEKRTRKKEEFSHYRKSNCSK
jgi:hypothetical protein